LQAATLNDKPQTTMKKRHRAAFLFGVLLVGFVPLEAETQTTDPRVAQIDEQEDSFKRHFEVIIAGWESQAREMNEKQTHRTEWMLRQVAELDQKADLSKVCSVDDFSDLGGEVMSRYQRLGEQLLVALRSDMETLQVSSSNGSKDIFNYIRWADAKTRRSIELELSAIWKERRGAAYTTAQGECLASILVRQSAAHVNKPTETADHKSYATIKENLTAILQTEKNKAEALTKMLVETISFPK
jgi:hypothetical protein